jgi:ribose 5-phosphate isomerase A
VSANPHFTKNEDLKLRVAKRALELVKPGMMVGLGSGSTATLWIELLGEQVRDHGLVIHAIASSEDSDECGRIDVTVDGADEVAPGLALIKGGGGKLLREKIVASASEQFVVIADESKVVDKLGRFPLPVEVIPMAAPLVRPTLERLGFQVALRKHEDGSLYITDEGNLLFDCSGMVIDDPPALAALLDRTVGVVEHGLFLNMANHALIATESGVVERDT